MYKRQISTLPKDYSYKCSNTSSCSPYVENFVPGEYFLEVWGADGGSNVKNGIGFGGKGGYSHGILNLTAFVTLYIFVGGKGSYSENHAGVIMVEDITPMIVLL